MRFLPYVHTAPRHPVDRVVEMEARIGVSGYLTVQLIRRDGSIKQELNFKNLITNGGLDALLGRGIQSGGGGTNNPITDLTTANIMYAAVGTGSTTPAITDTTLVSEVTPSSSNRTNSDGGFSPSGPSYTAGSPDYWQRSATFLFDFAQGNGNLTEVALIGDSSSGLMFMRQLFKDGGGTPTTVVKTSAEQLRVIYRFRIQPLQSDVVQSAVAISGTNYDITTRAANADQTAGWGAFGEYLKFNGNIKGFAYETQTLGARTTTPAGSNSVSTSKTESAYSNGTWVRDVRYEWSISGGNFALGIGSVVHGLRQSNFDDEQMFQSSFSPRFAKDNTKRLRLDVRYTIDRV